MKTYEGSKGITDDSTTGENIHVLYTNVRMFF